MNGRSLAIGLTVAGATLLVLGVALIYFPAGLVTAGIICSALGLLGVRYDR